MVLMESLAAIGSGTKGFQKAQRICICGNLLVLDKSTKTWVASTYGINSGGANTDFAVLDLF